MALRPQWGVNSAEHCSELTVRGGCGTFVLAAAQRSTLWSSRWEKARGMLVACDVLLTNRPCWHATVALALALPDM